MPDVAPGDASRSDARPGFRFAPPGLRAAALFAELPAVEAEALAAAAAGRRRGRLRTRRRLGARPRRRAGAHAPGRRLRLVDADAVAQHLVGATGDAHAALAVGALAGLAGQRADPLVEPAHRLQGVERGLLVGHGQGGELGEFAQRRLGGLGELAVDRALEAADALELELQVARDLLGIERRRRIALGGL